MYKAIVNHLCCPKCRGDLTLKVAVEIDNDVMEGLLACENNHTFQINQGIADFNSNEQSFANQWESMSEEQRFADLDREMDAKNPDAVLERREMVLDAIVSKVAGHNGKVVLDIASGRGLLLTKLASNLADDVHILSVDLSAYVLKYDRQKFKRLAPGKKISYLACDATNLPIKECVIDAAATYCGFSNMLGCAGEALQEAHRVLKPGGVLLDSFVVIGQDSKGCETLRQICAQQNITGAEEFFLHEGLNKNHSALFADVACNTVFEGIGVGNGMDLLPYPGEWYAEQVFISRK